MYKRNETQHSTAASAGVIAVVLLVTAITLFKVSEIAQAFLDAEQVTADKLEMALRQSPYDNRLISEDAQSYMEGPGTGLDHEIYGVE